MNLHQDVQSGKATEIEREMKYVGAGKCSSMVIDKVVKVMDKTQAKRAKAYMSSGIPKNPFTIPDNFPASHFVSVAQTCGIKMGGN
jgi:hypothetical protein